MRFLFTCGGTAGHINPALGVAGRLRELLPQAEFLFIGADGHMETELVPREGYPIRTVPIAGFRRGLKPKMIWENVRTAGKLAVSMVRARKYLKEFKPDVAIGTGGYVCYPVLKAASDMAIPTAVHESNAVPGLTTRLLEKQVDHIMVGFEESRQFYRHPDKVEVTGTPVRVDFCGTDKAGARKALGLDLEQPMVLAVFGSLGAGYMNAAMEGFIRRMRAEGGFRLIYGTGKQYYGTVRESLLKDGPLPADLDLREYIYDMPAVMSAADLILCRGGASTISELTYLGKPAVIVPSPNVVNNHQEKNARVLMEAGAARMLLEGQFDGSKLYDEVRDLLFDARALEAMHDASQAMGAPDATDRIVSAVLTLAKRGKTAG